MFGIRILEVFTDSAANGAFAVYFHRIESSKNNPMASLTKVTAVAVTARCHSPLHQPRGGVTSTGTSEIPWNFKGTYFNGRNCVVVIEAGKDRSAKACSVNHASTGGVFPEKTDGTSCELTLDHGDLDNWTVAVATDGDVTAKKERIFQGGTGRRIL